MKRAAMCWRKSQRLVPAGAPATSGEGRIPRERTLLQSLRISGDDCVFFFLFKGSLAVESEGYDHIIITVFNIIIIIII